MSVTFDPTRVIDTSVPPPARRPGRIGWYGPFPSRPCDNCGTPDFHTLDWGMGYHCIRCGAVFGTPEEWRY